MKKDTDINARIAALVQNKATKRQIKQVISAEFSVVLSEGAISSRLQRMRRCGIFGLTRYANMLTSDQRERMEQIVREESARFNTDAKSVMSGACFAHMIKARHSAMLRISEEVPHRGHPMSSPLMASFFGCDHTTVLNALGRLGQRRRDALRLDRVAA